MVIVPLALFGWIPAVLLLFGLLPPRRAALTAMVAGWLLLPPAMIKLPGLPDYAKWTACGGAVLLATAVFAPSRFGRFRPRWFDLPMLAFLVTPFFSVLANGLPADTATSTMLDGVAKWGVPYFLGRIYLDDAAGLREAAVAILVGALAYVPPFLFELRFSPVLLSWVYGFHLAGFDLRGGSFRPSVFLASGLEMGLWLAAASLAGYSLWRSRTRPHLAGLPTGLLLAIVLVIALLCRATGARLLLAVGLALMWGIRRTGRVALLWPLVLAMPLYEASRVTGFWSGRELHDFAARFDEERAQSLGFRLRNEDILIDHALKRPLLGWGYGVRNRVYDENGKDISITDGCWILVLGYFGLIGLTTWTAAMITPGILVARRGRAPWLSGPEGSPVLGLAIVWLIYGVDCLANDMNNQVYALAAGGVASVAGGRRREGEDEGGVGVAGAAADERTTLAAAHEARAAELVAAGRPEEADLESRQALGLLEAVLADRADDPGAWEHLALGYEAFARSLGPRATPREVAALWDRAIALLDEAEARFAGAAGLRVAAASARNDAAWQAARRPIDSPEEAARAVRLAEEAVERAPRDAPMWNTLGAAYHRAGNAAAAVAALEQGRRLDGRDTAYDALVRALAHHARGDAAAARSWWERGRALAEALGRRPAGLPADLRDLRDEAGVIFGARAALTYTGPH